MKPYYEQDGCTIWLGDCREILPQLSAVDHCITDPPYARDVYTRMRNPDSVNGAGKIAGDSTIATMRRASNHLRGNRGHGGEQPRLARLAAGDIGCIDKILVGAAVEIARLAKRWALVFSDAETTWRWKLALENAGMRYVRTGAWVKPDAMPQMSGDRPAVGFEPCTIAHAQGRRMRWNGGGRQAVWTYGTAKVNRPAHPCPKPEPLMIHLVTDFTDAGETILDPFMGSGTTLLAAKRLGRKAIGIEISEKYAEVAARRLDQGALFTPQPDLYTPSCRSVWESGEKPA